MATPSRSEVLSLFRSLLRAARQFPDYNIREYTKRRTIDAFRENQTLSDASSISSAYAGGKAQLEVAKRQALVYSLYAPKAKSIMDVNLWFPLFFFFLVLWICSIWEFLWELNCILTFCCYQLWEKFFPSHSEFSCELNSERKIRDFFFLVPNLSSLSPVMMDWWIFSSGFSNVWCLWRSSNVEFRLTDNISMSHFLCYAKKEGSSVWTWMTILLLDEEILCVLGFNILAQSRIGCSELFLGICQ